MLVGGRHGSRMGMRLSLLRLEGVGELGCLLGHGQGVEATDHGPRSLDHAHLAESRVFAPLQRQSGAERG